jgi:hypothetical protein
MSIGSAISFLLLVSAVVSGFIIPSAPQSPSRRTFLQASASSDTAALPFPVLRRIAGIEWTGACRYVGAELTYVKDLKLFGGIRYELANKNGNEVCTLSSFFTFPDGKTREVVMTGNLPQGDGPLKLEAVGGDGPIYMLLTELAPDTILINEMDQASGNVVLTASLSLVGNDELVQVSHEVGDAGNDSASSNIEGHQVWRLKASNAGPR